MRRLVSWGHEPPAEKLAVPADRQPPTSTSQSRIRGTAGVGPLFGGAPFGGSHPSSATADDLYVSGRAVDAHSGVLGEDPVDLEGAVAEQKPRSAVARVLTRKVEACRVVVSGDAMDGLQVSTYQAS
jgi:hypothetical protein